MDEVAKEQNQQPQDSQAEPQNASTPTPKLRKKQKPSRTDGIQPYYRKRSRVIFCTSGAVASVTAALAATDGFGVLTDEEVEILTKGLDFLKSFVTSNKENYEKFVKPYLNEVIAKANEAKSKQAAGSDPGQGAISDSPAQEQANNPG